MSSNLWKKKKNRIYISLEIIFRDTKLFKTIPLLKGSSIEILFSKITFPVRIYNFQPTITKLMSPKIQVDSKTIF